MKFIAPLSFAAVLALGLATSAHAFSAAHDLGGRQAQLGLEYDHVDLEGKPYHRCHGSTSGTGHPTCGSLTGGPSGGLF